MSFRATGKLSAFPNDNGSDVYIIRTLDYAKMSYEDEYIFDPEVEVWIPKGYIGHIYKNDSEDKDIEIVERYLSGGNWHPLAYTVKFMGQKSYKVYGERDLACLKIRQCE